jgi:5-methylthioadenosine/S-adenosylhomocysteine deaminase
MSNPAVSVLTPRWVFPISSPPIADGAVATQGGRILAVGTRADLTAAWPGASRFHLPEAALLPGLVNCHTHLELSGLSSQQLVNGTFVLWLAALIEKRRGIPVAEQAAAAEAGARRLIESGTTCVGEVSTAGLSLAALLSLGLRGVVYREILGLTPGEAERRCDAARADLQGMQQMARGGLLRVGLSPHSPYSLSEELFRACGAMLRGSHLPCCIHAAESREEVEFLSTGRGAISDLLYTAVGCRVPPPRRRAQSPIEYLDGLGALAWRPLLIHAVHVDAADIPRMVRSGVSVAHCPRSNARLSDGVAPVADFLAHGIPVGLGTDSLASVPTLDLWDEMRAALAAQRGRLAPGEVLDMATRGGARALGLADQVGSLEVGKRADLIAVPAGAVVASDPAGSLIAMTRGEDVLLSLVEGEVRHHRLAEVPCA